MSLLRRRLPRLAALVLLLWLFATGVAFAHACSDTVDLECYECCAEMKPSTGASSSRADSVPAAQLPLVPLFAPQPAPASWPALELAQAPRPAPSAPGGPQPIPIVFLRLAL